MRLGEKVKIEIFDLPKLLIWLMLKRVSVGLEMAGKFKLRNEVCRWRCMNPAPRRGWMKSKKKRVALENGQFGYS